MQLAFEIIRLKLMRLLVKHSVQSVFILMQSSKEFAITFIEAQNACVGTVHYDTINAEDYKIQQYFYYVLFEKLSDISFAILCSND